MKFIYLGIFIISTTIHLIGSFKKNQKIRDLSKGYILLSILGFYLECMEIPSWFAIIAILLSWLGDICLIGKGLKWFTAGGIAFLISHAFFILEYNRFIDFNNVPIYAIIIIALVYILAVVFIFIKLKQFIPKAIFIPMFAYLLINGCMNSFAFYRLISNGANLATIITFIGALLFLISDTTLFFVRFNKNSRLKSHFLVMLTYSIGEFLIILGLIL